MTMPKTTKRAPNPLRAFLKAGKVVPMVLSVGKSDSSGGHLDIHGVSIRKDGLWIWGTIFESGEPVSIRLGK